MPDIVLQGYRDRCYTLGSLFVGSTGGVILGYWTKLFNPNEKNIDKLTLEMRSKIIENNQQLQRLRHIQLGGSMCWRIGAQAFGSMIMYSYLECKFQGGWPRRSIFDCATAGAITGGAFGLRGTPGGKIGALYGAMGFATYAAAMWILIR